MPNYYLVALSNLLLVPVKKTKDSYEITSDLKYIDNKYAALCVNGNNILIDIATKEVLLNASVKVVLNDIAVLSNGTLYDLKSKKIIDTNVFRYANHKGDIIELACYSNYNNILYNTKTRKFISINKGDISKTNFGDKLSVSFDGRYAIYFSKNVSELWDLQSDKLISSFRGSAKLYNDYVKTEMDGTFRLDPFERIDGLKPSRTSVVDDYVVYKGSTNRIYNADTMEVVSINKPRDNEEIVVLGNFLISNKSHFKGTSYIENLVDNKKKYYLNKIIIPISNKYIGIHSKNGDMKIFDLDNKIFIAKFIDVIYAEAFGDLIVLTKSGDRSCYVFNPKTCEQTTISCSGFDTIKTDESVFLFTKNCKINYIHAPEIVEKYGKTIDHGNTIVDLYQSPELKVEEETILKRTK